MLIGSFYGAYLTLQYYGAGQLTAMVITGALIMMTTALLFFFVRTYLHNLRRIPQKILKHSSLTSRAMDALDAFTEGLMAD